MSRLSLLTPGTAKGAAQAMLADLVERHGQVGSMVSTMAHSPAVLGGYLQLSRAMRRAKLDRRISERISIAVQGAPGLRGLPGRARRRSQVPGHQRRGDRSGPTGHFD